MCIWIGLGVRKSSGILVRARYRLRGGKDSRFVAVRVILGLHATSLPLLLLRDNSSMKDR